MKKNTIYNLLKANIFVAKILFKNTPLFIMCYAAINIATSLIPAIIIILSKNIIDGLAEIYNNTKSSEVWQYIILLFILIIVNSLFTEMGMTIPNFIREKNEKYLTTIITDKFSKMKIKYLEDKKSLDIIQTVVESGFNISGSFTYFLNIPRYLIIFISMISIIFVYYPIIALFYILTTIPGVIINNIQAIKMNQFSIDSIPENRKKNYYYGILTQSYYAKDLRLYNLTKPFKNKFNELWNKIFNERERIFRKGFKILNFSTLLNSIGYIVLYIYLIYKMYTGDLSIGGLAAFTAGIFTISNNISSLVGSFMTYNSIFLPRVLNVIEFFNWENENNESSEHLQFSQLDGFDLTFNHVTFKYPNTEIFILKDLSFNIKNGDKIALVGVNGAGKSTIVKLLLRMYEPDEGEILINGVNIQDYNVNSYRENFSACFQDIIHYSLTFAENIALSNLENIDKIDSIINAANASGLDSIQENWDKKHNTPLTRSFEDDGVELSGGQWQKIAIARTFFKNAPFIILDEPSAALDPKAESQIFNSFSNLCGNKSGLLISHRLSSIMLVDKIMFLENGQIIESGTHNELMNRDGIYAQMYTLQAEKYKIKSEEANEEGK